MPRRPRSQRRASRSRGARGGAQCGKSRAGFSACLLEWLGGRECRGRLRKGAFCRAGDRGERHVLCRGSALRCLPISSPIPGAAAEISIASCCRCATRSKPIGSVLWRIRSPSPTAAPAIIARRWRCWTIRASVRANLSGQTLDRYLDHYLTVWAQPPDVPLADATCRQPQRARQARRQHKLSISTFPAAASIPAISIMNPEPKDRRAPPPSPPRLPVTEPMTHRLAVAKSAQAGASAPAQAPAARAADAAGAAVDPVWPPGGRHAGCHRRLRRRQRPRACGRRPGAAQSISPQPQASDRRRARAMS